MPPDMTMSSLMFSPSLLMLLLLLLFHVRQSLLDSLVYPYKLSV